MDIKTARKTVINAGIRLMEAGLIARTWGNVSCRISDTQFVITPSGKPYETLTPGDIVTVNIDNLSYAGNVKPSSEKGIHALVYKVRPEINVVIHTHQVKASVISPLNMNFYDIPESSAEVIGKEVLSASYGLPGTKKLRNGIARVLIESQGNAFIMPSHGALCLGEDCDKAFAAAMELEQICDNTVQEEYLKLTGDNVFDKTKLQSLFLQKYIQKSGKTSINMRPLNSTAEDGQIEFYSAFSGQNEAFSGDPLFRIPLNGPLDRKKIPMECLLHRAVYRNYGEIRAIVHSTTNDIRTVSCAGITMHPLLDDFAQILGVNVKTAAWNRNKESAKEILMKLKGRNCVMLQGLGALCCGKSKSDALAAALVMDKGCQTLIGTTLFGGAKPIGVFDCVLMRAVYTMKYSKEAQK